MANNRPSAHFVFDWFALPISADNQDDFMKQRLWLGNKIKWFAVFHWTFLCIVQTSFILSDKPMVSPALYRTAIAKRVRLCTVMCFYLVSCLKC